MTALLEQIRPLLVAAEARVQTLREMERLALALDGAGGGTDDSPTPARHTPTGDTIADAAPRPEEEARARGTSAGVTVQPETVAPKGLLPVATEQTPPETPIAPGSGPSENGHAPRTISRDAVLAFVREHGRTRVDDVMTAFGASRSTVKHHVQRLVGEGLLDAEGNTRNRVYFTKQHGDQAIAAQPHATTTGASKPLSQLRADVLGVIRDSRLGINEPDIADSIDVDREDVAVACGELLDQNRIHRRPDGAYVEVWT